jgi:hypothetical protein
MLQPGPEEQSHTTMAGFLILQTARLSFNVPSALWRTCLVETAGNDIHIENLPRLLATTAENISQFRAGEGLCQPFNANGHRPRRNPDHVCPNVLPPKRHGVSGERRSDLRSTPNRRQLQWTSNPASRRTRDPEPLGLPPPAVVEGPALRPLALQEPQVALVHKPLGVQHSRPPARQFHPLRVSIIRIVS